MPTIEQLERKNKMDRLKNVSESLTQDVPSEYKDWFTHFDDEEGVYLDNGNNDHSAIYAPEEKFFTYLFNVIEGSDEKGIVVAEWENIDIAELTTLYGNELSIIRDTVIDKFNNGGVEEVESYLIEHFGLTPSGVYTINT